MMMMGIHLFCVRRSNPCPSPLSLLGLPALSELC